MKKKLILVFVLFLSLTLVACSDTKTYNEDVYVIYFTGDNSLDRTQDIVKVEPGNLLEEPETPVRAGFAFVDWYKDYLQTEKWDFDTDVVGDESFTLYAKWESRNYYITYDTNGGTMPDNYVTEFAVGDSKVLPIPTRVGYSFIAWYKYDWEDESSTKPGDAGYQVLPSNSAEDLMLYAHWEAVVINVTFDVNYPVDGEGPDRPNSLIMYYGDIINFPTFSDTDNYVFQGWNSKRDGTGEWYVNGDEITRTQRTTVYAIWTEK